MANLHDLQKSFQDYVMGKSSEIEQEIFSANKANIPKRLAIYGEGYHLRLTELLKMDFPVLLKLLGTKKFDRLAYRYIDTYPSTYFSVQNVGRSFSHFLAVAQSKYYLSEMAAFEWALTCAVDAPNVPLLTTQEMAALPPESWPQMRLKFHPSFQHCLFYSNIVEVWRSYQGDATPIKPKKTRTPLAYSVWRKGLEPYYDLHTPEQALMIKSIQNGADFSAMSEALCQCIPEEEVAPYIVGVLIQWINAGMFCHH